LNEAAPRQQGPRSARVAVGDLSPVPSEATQSELSQPSEGGQNFG
jgi:hypothetical protein